MFRVPYLVAPLSVLLTCFSLTSFSQDVPVVVEIHADGDPTSIELSNTRSNDDIHIYPGDTLDAFGDRWAVYSKTENLRGGDTLDYQLNRVPNLTTTGSINHNTVTDGNLLGAQIYTYSNPTNIAVTATGNFSGQKFWYDSYNNSSSCSQSAACAASCTYTYNGSNVFTPGGCGTIWTTHWSWGAPSAWGAQGSNSCGSSVSCSTSHTGVNDVYQSFYPVWQNGISGWSWTDQFALPNSWTPGTLTHYGTKATRAHVAHAYWNELTITDAKLCVAAGHLYVWGDGNNSNQHQNGENTSIGTNTSNTNIGNSSQWSCRANNHSKNDLIAVRNVGANGGHSLYHGQVRVYESKTSNASNTQHYSASCSWGPTYWGWPSEPSAASTSCYQHSGTKTASATATVNYATGGFVRMDWTQQSTTGEAYSEINSTAPGVIGETTTIDEIRLTLNAEDEWQNTIIHLQAPNGDRMMLRGWQINLPSNIHTHTLKFRDDGNAPLSCHYSNGLALGNDPMHEFYQAWEGLMNSHFAGCSASGSWKVWVSDYQGYKRTLIYDFEIDFAGDQQRKWETTPASSDKTSGVGTDVHFDHITINHNLVNDVNWTLKNTTNGSVINLGAVESGIPVHLHNENSFPVGALNDDWAVEASTSYWHPNEGKTISSWVIDYSGRSLPIGEGCVTSPNGCSTSSDPVLAGLDVVSVPEYDPQDKSWSLVAQEVETNSGMVNGQLRFLGHAFGTPGASSFNIGPNLTDYNDEILIVNGDDYYLFKTDDPFFVNSVDQWMHIVNLETNDLDLKNAVNAASNNGEATFCRGAAHPNARPGDTSWGILPTTSTGRNCGCNGSGWAGWGIFYGGSSGSTYCGDWGGRFAGYKANGEQKGGLSTGHPTRIYVRNACTDVNDRPVAARVYPAHLAPDCADDERTLFLHETGQTTATVELAPLVNMHANSSELASGPNAYLVEDLVAWYAFDGNGDDQGPYRDPLTPNGVSWTADRFGNPQSAVAFDGVDDHMLNDQLTGMQGSSSYTVAFWVRKLSANCEKGHILCQNNSAYEESQTLSLGYRPCVGECPNGGCFYHATVINFQYTTTNSTNSNWHHMAVTFDESTGRRTIFEDGVLLIADSLGRYSGDFSKGLLLGNCWWAHLDAFTDDWFEGQLDELGLWSRAFSDTEIQTLYQSSAQAPQSPPMLHPGHRYVAQGTTMDGEQLYDVYDLINDEYHLGVELKPSLPSRNIVSGTNDAFQLQGYVLDAVTLDDGTTGRTSSAQALIDQETTTPGSLSPFKRTLVDNDKVHSVYLKRTLDGVETVPEVHFLDESGFTEIFGAGTQPGKGNARVPLLETEPTDWERWLVVAPMDIPKTAPSEALDTDDLRLSTHASNGDAVGTTAKTPTWHMHPIDLKAIVSNGAIAPSDVTAEQLPADSWMVLHSPEAGQPWPHPLDADLQANEQRNVMVMPWDLGTQLWRDGADVDTYYSNDMVTAIDDENTISVSFPLTPPYYTQGVGATMAYTNADAFERGYPYWGIQNGTEAYAEIFVKLKDEFTGAEHLVYRNTKTHPLILKDCPYILQDSVRLDITAAELPSTIQTGDPIDVEAVVLWTTDARRTALWSKNEPHNRLTMCGAFNELFALNDDLVEAQDNSISSTTVTWNALPGKQSNGGFMRLQRRSGSTSTGEEDGWEYIKASATNNGETFTVISFDTPSILLTSDPNEAYVWVNSDINSDNIIDRIQFTDNSLLHSDWQCEQVEYRVEQEMCGSYFYTEPVNMTILGELSDPWTLDDELGTSVQVSQGVYANKVKINWASAIDPEANIMQFRVFRRRYEPLGNPAPWDLIFAAEDANQYEDVDLMAGTLYEYRMAAIMGCSTGEGSFETQDFYSPTNFIGFRTNNSSVSGTITYDEPAPEGPPSGNAMVSIEPQGTAEVRNALNLESDYFLHMDIPETSSQYLNWPNLTSNNAEWTLSQWVKISEPMESGESVPIVSFNFNDYQSNPSEAFSIWARQQSDGNLWIQLVQAGNPSTFYHDEYSITLDGDTLTHGAATEVTAPFNEYFHLSIRLSSDDQGRIQLRALVDENDIALRGHSTFTPALTGLMSLTDYLAALTSSDPDADAPILTPLRHPKALTLGGGVQLADEIRSGWSSVRWNAASAAGENCHSPEATNFAPATIGSSQDGCEFDIAIQGCADPAAGLSGGYNAALTSNVPQFAGNLAGGPTPCDYTANAFGSMISIRWFSDGSTSNEDLEFPVIIQNGQVIRSFHSALSSLQSAQGADYAFSMPVLTTKIPDGAYSIRVLQSASDVTGTAWNGLDAANFTGNFSVIDDHGVEYVNCLQYVASEATSGVYDFTVAPSACAALFSAAPNDTGEDQLITDCSSAYSVRYMGDAAAQTSLSFSSHGQSTTDTNPLIEFWFKLDGNTAGNILSVHFGSQDLTLRTETETSTGFQVFVLEDEAGNKLTPHTTIPDPDREFDLNIGQWYHAQLQFGDASKQSFKLRGTDYNDNDFAAWNDTRLWEWSTPEANSLSTQAGQTLSSLELGGGAEVSFHRVSIWENPLFANHPNALFNGIGLADLQSCEDCNGLWDASGNIPWTALRSVLVPNHMGQFVDQMGGRQLFPNGVADELGAPRSADETKVIWDMSATSSAATAQLDAIGAIIPDDSTHSLRKPTKTAPFGESNSGCSRVFNACNFNPFSNVFASCDLSCANVSTSQGGLISGGIILDEIRGFKGAPASVLNEPGRTEPYTSLELANYWRMKYPNNETDGLFLMYDADEGMGNIVYDRAKNAADAWNQHHAQIWFQNTETVQGVQAKVLSIAPESQPYHFTDVADLPMSLGNWDITNVNSGEYQVGNVKYSGTGTLFDVIPHKATGSFAHSFLPSQSVVLAGDATLNNDNNNFIDKSSFDVYVRVVYQDITGTDYSTENSSPSACPVEGVRFIVDNAEATDGQSQPYETNVNGYVKLSLSRGEHTIEPQLSHLNGTSHKDDHIFLVSEGGRPVTIEGPIDSAHAEVFVDLTVRRMVGRIIGGQQEASLPWGTSLNNLGKASLWLSPQLNDGPVYADPQTNATFMSNHACPAVQIQTDAVTGQYDISVLPIQYVPAKTTDPSEAHLVFPSGVAFNDPEDIITVDGWQLETPGAGQGDVTPGWPFAFHTDLFVNGSGVESADAPHTVWDPTELDAGGNWNEFQYQQANANGAMEVYPEGLPSGDASHRITERVDLVYDPPMTLTAYQTERLSDSNGGTVPAYPNPDCNWESRVIETDFLKSPAGVVTPLTGNELTAPLGTKIHMGDIVLGEPRLFKRVNGQKYMSDFTGHLRGYALYLADQENNAAVFPFPLGLPIVETARQYCFQFNAGQDFHTKITDSEGTVLHEHQSRINAQANDLAVNITNTMTENQSISIPLNGSSTAGQYAWSAGEPETMDPTTKDAPTGRITASLSLGGNTIASWKPYQNLIGEDVLQSVTGGGIDDAYEHDAFNAIVLGNYVSGQAVPLSSDPSLMFILRDPPGGASSASISEGKSMGYSREVETSSGTNNTMSRNIDIGFGTTQSGQWLMAPFGVGKSEGAEISVGGGGSMTQTEEFARNEEGGVSVNETLEFNQTVTTSGDAANQDLFFGRTRNSMRTEVTHFALLEKGVASDMSFAQQTAQAILDNENLGTTMPAIPHTDNDGDGVVDQLIMMQVDDNNQFITTNDPTTGSPNFSYHSFIPTWHKSNKTIQAPASMFMYTEYTIENIMIPQLEAQRDQYAASSSYYQWPTGQTISLLDSEAPEDLDYPEGMKLANNDDPRWSLYHENWLSTMRPNYPQSAVGHTWEVSTIKRGYQTGNANSTLSEDETAFMEYTLGQLLENGNMPSFFPDMWKDTYVNTLIRGDDRKGPGYIFSVPDAELAAINANRASQSLPQLQDIELDSVRYYNTQIGQWKKILAKNELDKLNARYYLTNNLDDFDDPSEINSWRNALTNTSSDHLQFNIEDLAGTSEDALAGTNSDNVDDVDLWSGADFEPYVIAFSGGGAEFTQSIAKTNTKTEVHAMENAALISNGGGMFTSVGDYMGYNAEKGASTSYTEKRTNSTENSASMSIEYTLSDPDEEDFFLVAVVPGSGMDGPIFVTLGGVSSCEHEDAIQSKYWEWFPSLVPGEFYPHGSNFTCGTNTTPVWNRTVDLNYTALTPSGEGSWNPNNSAEGDLNLGANDDQMGAMLGGAAGAAVAIGVAVGFQCISCGVSAGVGAAAMGIMGGIDIAVHAGWRMNRLAELGTWEDGLTCTPQNPLGNLPQHLRGRNLFGYQTGANQTTNQICQAGFVTGNTKEYTYTMAPQVCSALAPAATATLREETFVVKPTTVAAERAELTFSHDYLNPNVPDLVGVSSTTTSLSAPQNETIGVTLHMKHNPLTDPYGDVAEYILFSDPLANTAGFNVNLGGLGSGVIGSTTGGYGLAPAWSTEAEDYDIFMSINHSGVDGAYNGPIDIIMQSACDSEIADTVRIPITFEPACSQVELNEPYEGFVGNLDEIRFSPSTAGLDGENRMDVLIDVEREDFTNWSTEDPNGVLGGGPVVVEFRTDNTIWSTISNRSDYGTNGTITLDGNNMLSDPSFSWNPKMPASICGTTDGAGCTFEGNVFLRAKSQCANMFAAPEYSSEITGYLDFLRPNLFGDVLPLDHHYELGDEIKLRWSEAMETTAATESLQPVEVQVSGTFNDNFQSNSGGVAFMGNEYLGVPEGPNLEAYLPSLDVGTPGWHFSCRLYKEPGTSVAASHVGHIMTVGDIETAALAFELHGSNTLKVNWYVAGQVQASHTDVLPTLGNGWNTLQLELEPKVGGDGFDIIRTLGTVSSYPILISNFSLPNRRVTFGNGWQNGAPTGQPLAYPIQDIRLWSSMRETVLSEEPAFALFGNEMGLQLWLPLDELEGVPVDEARNRGIEMAGNWFSDQPSHALDMAGNADGSMILSAPDITASPSLARNATLEFWVKPASNGGEQCILGINPAGDINLDANGLHWNIELDNSQNLKVVNNGNTLLSSTPVTAAWHHVALVRELGGALTLYLDGENVASGPADSFGPLLPQYIHIGGRRTGGGHDYDRFFTGKLDELRVWATNLPIATIREHTREAVQGHPDLMVHMPFEAISYEDCSDGSTLTSTSEEYFSYALNEQLMGYDFIENGGNNDEESMLDIGVSMCHASKYEFGNHCCASPTADLANFITDADAPLMQAVSQTQFTTDAVASVTWNSLHDEMILQLSEAELWKLEDQLVTFTLPKDQVRDAYGNAVSNNVVFDLLIDRNPLNWGDEFLSEVRMTDDEKTFTTTIVNSGYEVKTFEIVGAPTWLEVTPSSGQIMPQSEMTISISAPEFMNIGEYACDLHLKGGLPCGSAPASHCYGDRFAFNLDVQVQSPDFSVDSWMFESLCPVTAQVYINDIASSNPRNVVLAYIGGELRGVAKTDMPVSGNQLAFLSVYYNALDLSSDGVTLKPIEFRVWDASTGIVRALCTAHHPTIHDAAGTFLPTTNGHGSMFQPLRIKAGTGVQTQTTLTPGWNWVSFNIEPDASEDYMESMFSGIQNTDIVQIKSHNLSETFFSSGVWQPNAPRIDVNARYEVKMATANPNAEWTLSNLGNAANEDATIKQGWNDLGFMPQQPMSTEVSLRSLADAEILQPNDLIASRYEGFALYAGDGEWVGSLTTMRPGQGYRLRVGTPDPNNAPTLGMLEWPEIPTFINPNWLHHNPLTGVSRPDDAWSMNVQDCPDMMTIVARTVLPSDQSPSPGDHLGAFILDADGEPVCIGQALPKMTDNGICHFLSLYRCHGEDPTLHFKWRSGISGEELDALEVLSFQASSMTGTLQEPIQFTFEKREELTLEPGHLVAYPNPFREQITVYWHGMERVESLTVRDANGRLINRLDCNGINDGPCTWETADIAPGVYFITALTERGPRTIKVVK